MPKVEIKNDKCTCFGTKVLIDGNIVHKVRSIDFRANIDEVPTFMIEVLGAPDISTHGQVIFDISPGNLSDACLIVDEELKKCSDFYEAFLSGVKSVLKDGIDYSPEDLADKKAKEIVKLISGE